MGAEGPVEKPPAWGAVRAWILRAPESFMVRSHKDYSGSLLLCKKPPQHLVASNSKSFILLMYLQFGQSLAGTTHLCSMIPGASLG